MALGGIQITDDLVSAVRDAIDIVDIAREHTQLKRSGKGYQGLCPLHQEKTPSFSVEPGQNLFYCFGCGRGGDAIRLHMLLSGDDFPAAIERLALRYGIPMPAATPAQRKARDAGQRVEQALEKALEFYRRQLEDSTAVGRYLEGRKIPAELIDRFQIGYAPDAWTNLVDHLSGSVGEKDLLAAGLIGRSDKSGRLYDRFRNRIIFPIHNAAGRLVGFGGRTLDPDEKAKYVNTAETAAFRKRSLLYGLHLAKRSIRERERAVLVEGYMDVIGSVAAGVDNVVAGMGTSLTTEQAKLLARHADEVVLAYDGDSAGVEASRKALPVLLVEGMTVRTAALDEVADGGMDPDTFRVEEGDEAWQQRVRSAGDAVWRELQRLTPDDAAWDPPTQARAAREIERTLLDIPDSITRQAYARRVEGRLGLPPGSLNTSSTSAARQRQDERSADPSDKAEPADRRLADTEVKVLQWLLSTDAPPPLDELPPPQAFLDSRIRNIYQLYLRLYQEVGGPPGTAAVQSALPLDGDAVDLLAGILIELPATCSETEAFAALERLESRWLRTRRLVLQDAINRAQERGDTLELEKLLAERTRLTSSLHRRTT